jgi:hypothetical protein
MFYLEQITIELAIIRGVAQNTLFGQLLFSWLTSVVKQACDECRNVRVSVLFNCNCNCHLFNFNTLSLTTLDSLFRLDSIWGHVMPGFLDGQKSYTKKLDDKIKIDHDLDTVGALSIMWSLVQSVMPVDLMEHVDSCLAKDGLPRLATRNVKEGFFLLFILIF